MNKQLILISIGPVQEFIASARKLRDLWFGSHMLSELSKSVAKHLADRGCALVFPAPENMQDLNQDSSLLVANKILAEAPADADAASICAGADNALRERMRDFGKHALKNADQIGKISADEGLFHAQLVDLGEFYAAWTPVSGDYASARKRVETLLVGRKSLRNFSAPDWDGTGKFKSSLDGLREDVIKARKNSPEALLGKSEKLDAIGLIKRFAPFTSSRKDRYFDDLSDVAVLPFFDRLRKINRMGDLEQFEGMFSDDHPLRRRKSASLNGPRPLYSNAYFPDHLTDKADEEHLKRLKGLCKAANCKGPNPYTCILVGDGDKMGETLDRMNTGDAHRLFSKKLADFAGRVGERVQAYDGSLIYSGGDDVMAYLPLHRVLDAACAIQQDFHQAMSSAVPAGSPVPTFSAGIAIVHHHEALSTALDLARRVEKHAKQDGGRDALAIVMSKRNGGITQAWGKWNTLPERLESLIDLRKEGILQGTLPYQLREIAKQSGTQYQFAEGLHPRNATAALAKRLIQHKQNTGGKEEQKEKQKLIDRLAGSLQGEGSILDLSGQMILARVLHDARALAEGIVSQPEHNEEHA